MFALQKQNKSPNVFITHPIIIVWVISMFKIIAQRTLLSSLNDFWYICKELLISVIRVWVNLVLTDFLLRSYK